MGPSPLSSLPHLDADLARLEDGLRLAVTADDPFLTEVASHLVTAGGKRLRPALTLATAATAGTGPATAAVIDGGIAVELVHLGSLYHDDVMDEALTRRTVESVNARWGNLRAILAGDFLLARASEIAASLGADVAGLLAATIARLCEGQVRELQHAYDLERSRSAYFAAIDGKTAALFATACRIGAMVSDLPADHVEVLTGFGRDLGMAFQIVDDVLDVVATDAELGKPAGNDLVEGVYTLPVLLALEGPSGAELRPLLGRPLDRSEVPAIRALVQADGAVPAALAEAHAYAQRAAATLMGLGDGPAVAAMAAVAEQLVATVPTRTPAA